MPYLTITRLRLKSRWMTPKFLIANEPIFQQLMNSDGYLDGKTLLDFGRGAWTLTLWKDAESMRNFYQSGAHRSMMPLLDHYADEGANRTVEVGQYTLPSWKKARDILAAGAKFSQLVRTDPSPNQLKQIIPKLWFPLMSRPLKAKRKPLPQAAA